MTVKSPVPAAAGIRLLMIGLDSSNLRHIRGALHRLPNLRHIFESGVQFDLASSADCLDASAWPTFYTGSLPGEHGLYHPMQWDPAGMRMRRLSADWFYAEPFWYALAREGVRVISADVPMVLPGDMPNGVEVRNWGTQENTGALDTSPPALAREIAGRFGCSPMGRDVPIDHSPAGLAALRRRMVAAVSLRTRLWLWLLQQSDWRLAITVFAECHRAGHNFWPDASVDGAGETLLEVYEAIDRSIGEMLAAVELENTAVVLFSAHSMGRNTSQSHLMQRIMDRVNATFWQSLDRQAEVRRGSVLRLLRENLPPAVQRAIVRSTPERFRDWVVDLAQRKDLDWSVTPGLAVVCGQNGLIRFNISGREKEGMFARDSELYARYIGWMRDSLIELRAAGSDAPLVAGIEYLPDRFPGPRNAYLPDISVRWADTKPAMEAYSDRLGRIRARFGTGRGGNHTAAAFAVVMAPGQHAVAFSGLRHTADLARAVFRCLAPQAQGRFSRAVSGVASEEAGRE
jgi:predicted AlkP superfamily phosphohydrolase/phosphomutase